MPIHTQLRRLAATDLVAGDTVYLCANGAWTRDPEAALLIEDATTADLHLLDAEARAHEVSDPHLRRVDHAPG